MSKYAENKQGSSGVTSRDYFPLRKLGSTIDRFIPIQRLFDAFFSSVINVSASSSITANYNSFISVDASSGSVTISLPTAYGKNGSKIAIQKIDSSSNGIIVDPYNDETINGSITKTILYQWSTMDLISNGSNWKIT